MKWISTTIKKKWIKEILDGNKEIEFKGATDFWMKRLKPLLETNERLAINFLCGQISFKFAVMNICLVQSKSPFNIDGVEYFQFFEIHLGEQIGGPSSV